MVVLLVVPVVVVNFNVMCYTNSRFTYLITYLVLVRGKFC